ncbi:MAG: SdrD B-like domain-containing protein [Aeoliella sp.]
MALRFERLEERRMLATNLGEINGLVRNDLQNDNNTANDIAVVGLPVSLFRDGNGNSTFDGAVTDAQFGTTTNTDVDGSYSFTGLTEGTYFVQIAPTSDLQVMTGGDLQTVTFNATEAMGVTALTIDDFSTAQTVTANRTNTDVAPITNSVADGANANTGGVRDLFVEATSDGNVTLTSQFSGGSVIALESSSGTEGIARVTWDGSDGDGDTVDPTNLDIDFSDGGANFGVLLRVTADNKPGAEVTLRLHSGINNSAEATVSIVDQDGLFSGEDEEEIVVPFSAFTENVSGGGVDFDSVTAIEMELDFRDPSTSGLDARVELVGVAGNTVKNANFAVFNRMSLGDRVFADIDNNGIFDPGEVGIANVDLMLYEDTDGSGDFNVNDDLPMGTATTDPNGFYLFENLLPGEYIVQVMQTEFGVGQPLNGLISSTGNDISSMAPDPDAPGDGAVDLNNDDNGTAITNNGVVSKAITLIGNSEPINDGDTDDDTNRTVDFGFFGFDLVIDKQVSSGITTPGGQLTYTIDVTNSGPSTASTVSFTDDLPGEVTFSSGSTSDGLGVVHTAGTVTANLQDIDAGETKTVTIVVDVNNGATGILTNNASVSAPNESNPDNNDDIAVTTVNPQIDLELTKVDNDDDQILEPGDTIVYTLIVTNLGPSTATGVVVTDTLPEDVTFNVGASTTPSTNNDGVLTYNLGTLSSTDSTNITISVTIDDDFVGTLTNTAVVDADLDESDETNNDGTAQSLVAVQTSTLGGNVYLDADNDGVFDTGETPLAGVAVTLTGIDFIGDTVNQTMVTLTDGSYLFTNLLPGIYRVQETQPTFFADGMDTVGSENGDVADDDISQIVLAGGVDAVAYNFGELGPSLSKRRFLASSV